MTDNNQIEGTLRISSLYIYIFTLIFVLTYSYDYRC